MEPYFSDNLVTLYHGKAELVLPHLPPGLFDGLVTDPPFGIGFDYHGEKEQTRTPDEYWQWLNPIYESAKEKVRPGGLVAVWQAHLNFRHFWDWFGDRIRIYAACKNFVQMGRGPMSYGYDPVVMFYAPGADPLCPKKHEVPGYRSVDFFVADTASEFLHSEKVAHPCPRPLDQVCEIVRNFTRPGALLLDPFVGSGTLLLAAALTGRKAVGIEQREEFCEETVRRVQKIERQEAQGSLFAPQTAKAG